MPAEPTPANCTTNDQCRRRGSSAAERGTCLKDENRNKIDRFDGKESVEFSEHKLKSARREEICTPIPADIVDCFEVIRNSGNGSRDDSIVLGLY
jgi:hypothetical protein